MSDKTEEATPKRLRKAREDGDSGVSAFAGQAASLLVASLLAPAAVGLATTRTVASLKAAIATAGEASPSARFDALALASDVLTVTLPILFAAGVAAALVALVQSGGGFSPARLSPKLERLDVIAGLGNLVSAPRLMTLLRALLFAAVVAWMSERTLVEHAADLANVMGRPRYVGLLASTLVVRLVRDAALVGVVFAAVDVVVTKRSWKKRLRMSKDEVKREHKESDGDPQMKAARERTHHEMLASATIANVKTATVVVVNPTHLATALRYRTQTDEDETPDAAPVIVAAGEGDLAKQIVEAARAYGVPVVRDVPLARALRELEIGDEIPEALYEAVAEILRAAWEERG